MGGDSYPKEERTMSRESGAISLSAEERGELERLVRSHSTPQQLALRARMIVLAGDGVGVCESAQRLGVWRKGVSLWRARWLASGASETVAERLQDAPRSGARRRLRRNRLAPLWHWRANGQTRAGFRSATGARAIWRARRYDAASSPPSRLGRWGAF